MINILKKIFLPGGKMPKTKLTESDVHREVTKSVKSLIDFTKEKTVLNIVESARSGKLSIDDGELTKLTNIVGLSVEQAFSMGFTEVESAIKRISSKL